MTSSAAITSRGNELQKRDIIALSCRGTSMGGYRETSGTHDSRECRQSKLRNALFAHVSGRILAGKCCDCMNAEQRNCGTPVDTCAKRCEVARQDMEFCKCRSPGGKIDINWRSCRQVDVSYLGLRKLKCDYGV